MQLIKTEQTFEARRASLFSSLDNAANELGQSLRHNDVSMLIEVREVHEEQYYDTMNNNNRLCGMRGRRSIFLRPEAPITRCLRSRRVPDYQLNPQKWKKYTLADADDSDFTNQVAAHMFLSSMARQRSIEMPTKITENVSSDQKVVFRKQNKMERQILSDDMDNADAQLDSCHLKGSKLVMPEYVIGRSKKNVPQRRSKSKKLQQKSDAPTVPLQHLEEDSF